MPRQKKLPVMKEHREALKGFVRRGREARTRGPDYDHPINIGGPVGMPRRRRRPPDEESIVAQRVELLSRMRRGGATHSEMAAACGCTVSELFAQAAFYPELLEVAQIDWEAGTHRVEGAIYGNAVEKGETTAQQFVLKNKAGWKDKHEIDLKAEIESTDNTGTRELALALLQMLREAGDESRVASDSPRTIEHAGEPPTAPVYTATERKRRSFGE